MFQPNPTICRIHGSSLQTGRHIDFESILRRPLIKEYIFDNPKYTPHQPTAEAWQRLSQGKGTEHDKLLLKHETVEMFYNDWIPKNPKKYSEKYEPLTSHDISNIKGYNWEEEIPVD